MPLPNTENVEMKEFPSIKAGWYELILLSHEDKRYPEGTYTRIELESDELNRHIWHSLFHSEKSLYFVKKFKQSIGMPDEERDLTPYHGSRLMAWCQNKIYEGKNQIEITEIKALEVNSESQPPKEEKDSALPF